MVGFGAAIHYSVRNKYILWVFNRVTYTAFVTHHYNNSFIDIVQYSIIFDTLFDGSLDR
jgi:hypothetical protein